MFNKYFSKMYQDSVNKCRQSILDLCEMNPKAKLVDLGCNDGKFTMEIAEKIGTTKVYGVEINPKGAKEARKRKLKVYSYDLNNQFPFPSHSFDVVTANQIIEHLYNTDGFAHEIHRVLKPNGYAIISTNNLASWHNIVSLILGYQPLSTDVSNWVNIGKLFSLSSGNLGSCAHNRVFTVRSLDKFLNHHGFVKTNLYGIGYYPFFGMIGKIISDIDKYHSTYVTIKVNKSVLRHL